MMASSLLTLVHNRKDALFNTLAGIARGTVLPSEVVIVYMNDMPYNLPTYPFSIHEVQLKCENGLNLSAARNLAMANSSNDFNIFLDVDCIPESDLVAQYLDAQNAEDLLWTGSVRYLSTDASKSPDWQDRLKTLSSPDSLRAGIEPLPYELFWSLNFACSRRLFERIGGFDTRYVGYGAEDTDFAFQARKNGVRMGTVEATAYHQYHPSYSPPLNHLEKIVQNAVTFKAKWDTWPMEGWLRKFSEQGYIDWKKDRISLIRLPDAAELAVALK